MSDALLSALGARIRRLRDTRGWSRRHMAERSGLSERFLAQVESGEGNASIRSLSQIARALETSPAALLTPPPRTSVIALLGLRGAGKSTIGKALADRLGVAFVELDAHVEEAAGLSLREMFELHGEEYYRRVEREVLGRLLARAEPAVVATGGGIVTHAETFELLQRGATTVWLKATPEEHWSRVVAQGDHRPMENDPLAMSHLRELLAQREDLYRLADHTVDTSGIPLGEAVSRLADTMTEK